MSSVLDKLKQKLMVKPEINTYEPVNIKLNAEQSYIGDIKEEPQVNIKIPKTTLKIKNITKMMNVDRNELIEEFEKIKKKIYNVKNQNDDTLIEMIPLSKIDELKKSSSSSNEAKQIQETREEKEIKKQQEEKNEPEEPEEEEIIKITTTTTTKKIKPTAKSVKKINKKLLLIDEGEPEFKQETKQQEEELLEEIKIPKLKKRANTAINENINILGQETIIEIGDTPMKDRMPSSTLPIIKLSSYFMNNRKFFINFINNMFLKYRDELEDESKDISCDTMGQNAISSSSTSRFSLLTHQKLIRDYLNLYTPYRGLLLFHGLGSGKTCSSIAIAEGMKSNKKVIIMLPASLKQNYMKELKKCGDYLYKRNQFWEWISIQENPETLQTLSIVLNLPIDFIKKNKGAFLVNVTKPSNYEILDANNKNKLEEQIDTMIRNKYQFISYNGIRNNNLKMLTNNYTINIFDNSVVIIDESHNFVSRIVNKIKKEKDLPQDKYGNKPRLPISLYLKFYELLLSSKNTKIIMLSGTPIINYPNELGIMFNILRGYIKTWNISFNNINKRINKEEIKTILSNERNLDYINYDTSTKILTITRNPFGFENKYSNDEYTGVSKYKKIKKDDIMVEEERGIISDDIFEDRIIGILKQNDIDISKTQINIINYKCLPDRLETFIEYFSLKKEEPKKKSVKPKKGINVEEPQEELIKLTNPELFKKRIIGLTSYFRSAQEELLPRYDKLLDFHIIHVPMSDYQFRIYEVARQQERVKERTQRKKLNNVNDLYKEQNSTYKIFSRLYCNFVMPIPPGRPTPGDKNYEDLGKSKIKEKVVREGNEDVIVEENELEGDEVLDQVGDNTYKEQIKSTIMFLKDNANEYLSPEGLAIYSPKYLYILENIKSPNNIGLNLIYSQFRTLEGIGVFILVLEQNGFTHFKIKKNSLGLWDLDINEEKMGQPMFALYTGTETEEEKDIIRNIYNGDWYNGDVPENIVNKLSRISQNNNYGEIIKILMITASGSEGINLKNTRYVHVMESYWHSVRIEQVIGRARRICSHNNLEKQFQTVEVFLYLMTFTKEQLMSDESLELRLKDVSKRDKSTPLTSDELLYEISSIKEVFSTQLITAIKESSIDCSIYNASNSKEGLNCLSFSDNDKSAYSYNPNIEDDKKDELLERNIKSVEWAGVELNVNGKLYILNRENDMVYDYESYMRKNPILLGKLERKGNKLEFKRM